MCNARTGLVVAVVVVVLFVTAATSLAGDSEGIGGYVPSLRVAAGDAEGITGRRVGVPGDADNVGGQSLRVGFGDTDSVGGHRLSYYSLPMVGDDQDGVSGYASLLYWSPNWRR